MKEYLKSFFSDFGYNAYDAYFLLDSYGRITADAEAAELFDRAVKMYGSSFRCDFDALLGLARSAVSRVGLCSYTSELLAFACLSEKARKYYEDLGYSEEMYRDSMLDLKYKNEECRLIKGVPGTFVAPWCAMFFKMKLFGFGRLQFEVIHFGDYYEKNGRSLRPFSNVINTHIPRSGTPLLPDLCDEAFGRALEFFRADLGEDPAAVCHSWLLYPQLRGMLKPGSNLLSFMDRFDVYASAADTTFNSLWRLFDTDEKDPDKLPADSSLRRAFIAHLKRGGMPGWGKGVFFFD